MTPLSSSVIDLLFITDIRVLDADEVYAHIQLVVSFFFLNGKGASNRPEYCDHAKRAPQKAKPGTASSGTKPTLPSLIRLAPQWRHERFLERVTIDPPDDFVELVAQIAEEQICSEDGRFRRRCVRPNSHVCW